MLTFSLFGLGFVATLASFTGKHELKSALGMYGNTLVRAESILHNRMVMIENVRKPQHVGTYRCAAVFSAPLSLALGCLQVG